MYEVFHILQTVFVICLSNCEDWFQVLGHAHECVEGHGTRDNHVWEHLLSWKCAYYATVQLVWLNELHLLLSRAVCSNDLFLRTSYSGQGDRNS